MLRLAPIDNDSPNSSSDDMEVDSVIHDASGTAIGETRRRRPPAPNANYATSNTNIRQLKNIGNDKYAPIPPKEKRATIPDTDIYNTAREIDQVNSRMSATVTDMVGNNRTGEVPARPTQDTARPNFMTGMHDMRSIGERMGDHGTRNQLQSTQRSKTETSVPVVHDSQHAALRIIYGAYDKITKGLRFDRADTTMRLASANDRQKLVSTHRMYDTNRGKTTSSISPPQPDTTAHDTFTGHARNDNVSYNRQSLVLPTQGYGQIRIAGDWNYNLHCVRDRLEHNPIEVHMAEMQMHRGELTMRYTHTTLPTTFDGLIRTDADISEHERRFGHVHTHVGPVHAATTDNLTREVVDISEHKQRFGYVHTASGLTRATATDNLTRHIVDITEHEQRFGHVHTTTGHTHTAASDTKFRPFVNVATQQQRFGQVHTDVGPRPSSTTDTTTRPACNISTHEQRFGQMHTDVGHRPSSSTDTITRPACNISTHEQRFGHTQTNAGPTHTTANDTKTRHAVNITEHEQRFGYLQTDAGLSQIAASDAHTRPVLDISTHEMRFGKVHTDHGHTNTSSTDNITREIVDISKHQQRFGHIQTNNGITQTAPSDGIIRPPIHISLHQQRFGEIHIDTGRQQTPSSDGVIRHELNFSDEAQRFGHTQTTLGPLQPMGFDVITRTDCNISAHEQRFGHTQTTHGPVPGAVDDTIIRPQLNVSLHEQYFGKAYATQGCTTGQASTFEGHQLRKHEDNILSHSREIGQVVAYEGTGREALDTDRVGFNRTELRTDHTSCRANTTVIAAATHPHAALSSDLRDTKRTKYEENGIDNSATDLSWVPTTRQRSVTVSETPHIKTKDAFHIFTAPDDTQQRQVRSSAVATHDKIKKHTTEPTRRRPVSHQTVFTKLPVIYEAQRRITLSEENQPKPPPSEYSATQDRPLPYNEATHCDF